MAYGSSRSKKKKGSALRGLFADPGETVRQRKLRADFEAERRKLMRMEKGGVSEKEMEATLRKLARLGMLQPRK